MAKLIYQGKLASACATSTFAITPLFPSGSHFASSYVTSIGAKAALVPVQLRKCAHRRLIKIHQSDAQSFWKPERQARELSDPPSRENKPNDCAMAGQHLSKLALRPPRWVWPPIAARRHG
tara:strand:+ start:131 stop:493 length:363 start_codon:yes stop_codon:yes gene_type:complete